APLPPAKWGCLSGVIPCNARAMGEFGPVWVVSGHIAGLPEPMPLRVEKLYNAYNAPAAFAVASLLAVLALLTLALKSFLEWKSERDQALAQMTVTEPASALLTPGLEPAMEAAP